MWLPQKYIKENTSVYVQGEPFNEEDFCVAIEDLQEAISKYNPNVIGYEWDNENPKIQLEPIGERGYIELHPIK